MDGISMTFDEAGARAMFSGLAELGARESAEAANILGGHAAARAAAHTPLARAREIEDLENQDWWPKYVASVLSAKKQVREPAPNGRYQRYYSRQEAREFSKALIRGRKKRRGYLRAGWRPAVTRLPMTETQREAAMRGTEEIQRVRGSVKAAYAGGNLTCEIHNDAARDARGESIVKRAMEAAIRETEAAGPELLARHYQKALAKYQ